MVTSAEGRGLGTIARRITVCAQVVRRQLREAGLRATALVARTRLVTPVETAENIPSLLIQRQTKA